ncbi:glycosyltransferase family 2 protein [Morganella morganii subsp. morganii]|nr:glycosyltransferase family 2 protein [Morganella morganii subsp. morganii]
MFISVVSHNHFDIIKKINCLNKLSIAFNVILKSNIEDKPLEKWCLDNKIHYFESISPVGFGENNNDIFDYCIDKLGMTSDDYFIILNPDIYIEESSISQLISSMCLDKTQFAAINLFKDSSMSISDPSIRRYPKLSDFIISFFLKRNRTIIDKDKITSPVFVEWAAGSFLAISAKAYMDANGFDTSYFMYCEDIDLCYRLKKYHKINLKYFPSICAIHLAQHKNRNVFSKHFYWHLKSTIRFLLKK